MKYTECFHFVIVEYNIMFTPPSLGIQKNHLAHSNSLCSSHASYQFLPCFWSVCGIYMWHMSYTHTPELIYILVSMFTELQNHFMKWNFAPLIGKHVSNLRDVCTISRVVLSSMVNKICLPQNVFSLRKIDSSAVYKECIDNDSNHVNKGFKSYAV